MHTKYFISNFVFIFWNDHGTLIILIIFILIEYIANYSIILLRIKVSLEWKHLNNKIVDSNYNVKEITRLICQWWLILHREKYIFCSFMNFYLNNRFCFLLCHFLVFSLFCMVFTGSCKTIYILQSFNKITVHSPNTLFQLG